MEEVVFKLQRGILLEIKVSDELSGQQGEADNEKARIRLCDQPQRVGRLVQHKIGTHMLYRHSMMIPRGPFMNSRAFLQSTWVLLDNQSEGIMVRLRRSHPTPRHG
ncbi:hypothetical protein [Bradyrhizobium elkanii]|uniref:hypothetical protein n=1 Tax=Bradyrhizobium elkanii TaxID=29448 RepID=UPI00192B3C53|nr:hypothetical protein [Bradyrhizobium elkanii]